MPRKEPREIIDLGVFSASGIVDRRARLYVPVRPRDNRALVVMLDGRNVFGDEGAFAGGWHAHETADKLASAPAILAVDHGGVERIAELGAPRGAKLPVLIDLIVDRILPAAHARASLAYGPAAHPIVGSSMGGLAALFIHLRRPDVFGGAVCMSPSIWFDRRAILGWVDTQPTPPVSRVWLDAGVKEAGGRLGGGIEAMGEKLRARGIAAKVVIDPRGTHQEASWRRRLPKALRFVLGDGS